MIMPVCLYMNINKAMQFLVYALLDDQSDAGFVKDSTLETSQVTGPQVNLQTSTIMGENYVLCTKVNRLVVQSMHE